MILTELKMIQLEAKVPIKIVQLIKTKVRRYGSAYYVLAAMTLHEIGNIFCGYIYVVCSLRN